MVKKILSVKISPNREVFSNSIYKIGDDNVERILRFSNRVEIHFPDGVTIFPFANARRLVFKYDENDDGYWLPVT